MGKSTTKEKLSSPGVRRSSRSARCRRIAPLTCRTISSRSAEKRMKSPGFAPTASNNSCIRSSVKYLSRMEYISPSSRQAIQAMPLAPSEMAKSVRSSITDRGKSALPGTQMARTTPPLFKAWRNMEKSDFSAMSLMSIMGKSKRKSGLSEPYLSIASFQDMRGKAASISTPLSSRARCFISASRISSTSSISTKDISRSSWVNSS